VAFILLDFGGGMEAAKGRLVTPRRAEFSA